MVRLFCLVFLLGTSSSCVIYQDEQFVENVFVDKDEPCPPRTQADLFLEEIPASGGCNSSLRLVSVDDGPVDEGLIDRDLLDDPDAQPVLERSCAYLVTRKNLEPNEICF